MDRVVIGVDLGGTNTRTALMGRNGEIIEKHSEETLAAEGHEKVIAKLVGGVTSSGLDRLLAQVRGEAS